MKKMKLMAFAIVLAVAGCKSVDPTAALTANEWQMKSMTENGAVVENPQQLPEIMFSDSSRMFGSAGCNRFFGTYATGEKGMLTIKTGGATMMFCPDMNFEDRYLKALGQVASFAVNAGELTLTNADKTLSIVYVVADTAKVVGMDEDDHGCNASAGYTWSEVRQNCVRLFEDGMRMNSVTDTAATLSAFVVFAADSLQAEVFLPEGDIHPVLDRRSLPNGGYAWNQEDDDTLNVRIVDGNWVIEQRGNLLYSAAQK